jgi:hypothetical protein
LRAKYLKNHGAQKDYFPTKRFFARFCSWRRLRFFYWLVTLALWQAYAPWVMERFKLDEKELGALTLNFFANVRIVIVFFFLVPALALHWTSKKV